MNKPEIILVGGGGHCKSCIEVIESEGIYTIKGIIDLPNLLGTETLGYPVIGNDDDLPSFISKGYSFIISMGHMGNATRRDALFNIVKALGGKLPVIKASTAYVSSSAQIDDGTILMHHSMVNANSRIGKNCIVNSKALIEHDAIIGDYCHVSTGAIINGNCTIGNGSFIGSGSVIKNGIKIPKNTLIGMGSLVVIDIVNPGTYYGSPVKH